MTFITHGFRDSVVSNVRERVRDLGSPLRFMLRICLQSAEFFLIPQYVQPCLSKNPKYTFITIKSALTLAYNIQVLNRYAILILKIHKLT